MVTTDHGILTPLPAELVKAIEKAGFFSIVRDTQFDGFSAYMAWWRSLEVDWPATRCPDEVLLYYDWVLGTVGGLPGRQVATSGKRRRSDAPGHGGGYKFYPAQDVMFRADLEVMKWDRARVVARATKEALAEPAPDPPASNTPSVAALSLLVDQEENWAI